jgi:hypothetical protein
MQERGEIRADSGARVPYYIGEAKSDMRGIKPGWYAIEDDGNLSSGPFSSLEESARRITQLMNGDARVLG